LAIAWCVKNRNVSTVLLGATKEEQIQENLKSLEVATKMTSTHMREIEALLKNQPPPENPWGRVLVDKVGAL